MCDIANSSRARSIARCIRVFSSRLRPDATIRRSNPEAWGERTQDQPRDHRASGVRLVGDVAEYVVLVLIVGIQGADFLAPRDAAQLRGATEHGGDARGQRTR